MGRLSLDDRARWLHRTCEFALRVLHVRIEVNGDLPTSGLIVSNHLSYLDILTFSTVFPCVFVSKKEVRSWPVFGLLAHLAGTRFLDRARQVDAHRVKNEVQEALEAGTRVVVFPEGTSSDGSSVLPFKPALFEAVAGRQTVTAAHLRYSVTRGDVVNDVCYWGDMTFFPHLLRLLSKPTIGVHLSLGQPCEFADRKNAAAEMYRQVCELAMAEITEQVST